MQEARIAIMTRIGTWSAKKNARAENASARKSGLVNVSVIEIEIELDVRDAPHELETANMIVSGKDPAQEITKSSKKTILNDDLAVVRPVMHAMKVPSEARA